MRKVIFSLFTIFFLVSTITPKSYANQRGVFAGFSCLSVRQAPESPHHLTIRHRLTQRKPGGPGHPLRVHINTITKLFLKKKGPVSLLGRKNKRVTAAILAFPLPLGILGVHRLYLGTKPIVPIIYIVTLGGGLGILPFIDFVVLLLADDIQEYESNPHVFMWSND